MAIVSITLNPLLFAAIGPAVGWINRRERGEDAGRSSSQEPALAAMHRAVIVGYGPTGRTVTRLLRENQVTPTVIELNIDTVQSLRTAGIDVIHGDATRPDTLAAARVAEARTFIVSVSGLPAVEEALRNARRLNPRSQILARTD